MQYSLTPTSVRIHPPTPKNPSQAKPPKRSREQTNYKVNKSKVTKCIWLTLLMKRVFKHCYFYSVSFPKGIGDDTVYRIWNSWLTNLRQHQGLKTYIWVAERQGNGTIHFHVFIFAYIKIRKANSAMKSALRNSYSRKEITKKQYESSLNYNGVHISKNKKGKVVNLMALKGAKQRHAISNYVTKYVTKNEEVQGIQNTHLMWFCSRDISSLEKSMTFDDPKWISLWCEARFLDESKFFETEGKWIIFPWITIPETALFEYYIIRQELKIWLRRDPDDLSEYEKARKEYEFKYKKWNTVYRTTRTNNGTEVREKVTIQIN